MAWIKMRTNLDTDPRVLAMASTLGLADLHVVGCLWKVWSWADSHTLDGNAICVTDVTLDRFTGVTGFAQAMRSVGWLAGADGAISFPRFAEHNGQTAKKRAETAIRVAKSRNAKRVTNVTPKVLPEKRREEKIYNPLPPYDSEEVRKALSDWAAHYREVRGSEFNDLVRDNLLMEARRLGWDASALVANIRGSIARGWATVNEVGRPSKPSDRSAPEYQPLTPSKRSREAAGGAT
jgi:hypothetical protein